MAFSRVIDTKCRCDRYTEGPRFASQAFVHTVPVRAGLADSQALGIPFRRFVHHRNPCTATPAATPERTCSCTGTSAFITVRKPTIEKVMSATPTRFRAISRSSTVSFSEVVVAGLKRHQQKGRPSAADVGTRCLGSFAAAYTKVKS